MKRILAVTLALLVIISLSACGASKNDNAAASKKPNTIVITPDTEDLGAVTFDQLNAIKEYTALRLGDKAIITVDESNKQVIASFKDNIPEGAAKELASVPTLRIRDDAGKILMDGNDVMKAETAISNNDYVIMIDFTSDGTTKFAKITKENIGQKLNFYLDDTLLTSPTIQQEVTDGHAQISGQFTAEEIIDLSIKINAAILPFPLKAY